MLENYQKACLPFQKDQYIKFQMYNKVINNRINKTQSSI